MTDEVLAALKARDAGRLAKLLQDFPPLATQPIGGMPPLMMALYMRFGDAVQLLLRHGAVLDVFAASVTGDATKVRELVNAEPALLRATSADGWTALHLAAHFGQEGPAKELLSAGADIAARSKNQQGNTPLHAACAGAQDAMAKLLLARGAPADVADAQGYTPLHIAAANGASGAVQALLAAGARRDARTPQGKTALQLAEERDDDEAAALLRKA
ncbi:MAG: ankyrin repeat domain-containing protein [Halobacteriales archaeon]|nr:ankyrin repeat domain-containing protein [Halobacteriales archaeon]